MAWKEKALKELTGLGIKPVAIIYGNTGYFSALKEGMKRYGIKGMLKRNTRPNESKILDQQFSKKLKLVAKELDIPVYNVKNHNSNRSKRILTDLRPDLILLWGTGLIKKDILDIPKIGTLNGHYAILPKIRGMNVTEWSLLLGEEIGVTIHFVTPGVDLGDILYIKKLNAQKGDTLESIRLKCQKATSEGFVRVVSDISINSCKPISQCKEDGKQYFVMNAFLKQLLSKKLESM
jgi:methionyl-tRNA formyltransferase